MTNRISLLAELRTGGYEASLITTFNLHFPFYEEVVLRRLLSSGIAHNVVLADARMCTEALRVDPPYLAGRHYSFLPMSMAQAFHPKLIFLAGKTKGLMIVGSHNLTLAGFGFNHEATNIVRFSNRSDPTDAVPFIAALDAVDRWIDACSPTLPEHAATMVERVREFAPWLSNGDAAHPGSDLAVLAGGPGHGPLYDQFKALAPTTSLSVSVVGAFFDRELAFLSTVHKDFSPAEMSVSIQPETVSLNDAPPDSMPWRWTNAGAITSSNGGSPGGYLHAKLITIGHEDGTRTLVSGSANPSAPAWLRQGSQANAELVMVYRGTAANEAYKSLGLDRLEEAEEISEEQWIEATKNKDADQYEASDANVRTLIGKVSAGLLELPQVAQGHYRIEAVNADGTLGEIASFEVDETCRAIIQADDKALQTATLMRVFNSSEVLCAYVIPHHERFLDLRARTGIQRRLSNALSSLSTETPDLEVLMRCVEQVIFESDDQRQAVQTAPRARPESGQAKELNSRGLSVDVDEIDRKGNQDAAHLNNDLTYLLDVLIADLATKSSELAETDAMGRSEEEQIDADDETPVETQIQPANTDKIIDACQRKLGALIGRLSNQLQSYPACGEQAPSRLLRLLAVLAVVRHLSQAGPNAPWNPEHKPLILRKHLSELAEAAFDNVIEGESGLLSMRRNDQAFKELAQLRQLLLWLAWEVEVRFHAKAPFNEPPKDKSLRLKSNAVLLALTELFHGEAESVMDSAQVFVSQTPEVGNWLERVQAVAAIDREAFAASGTSSGEAVAGDIAIVGKPGKRLLRVVTSEDARFARLISLDPAKPEFTFQRASVRIVPAASILSISG